MLILICFQFPFLKQEDVLKCIWKSISRLVVIMSMRAKKVMKKVFTIVVLIMIILNCIPLFRPIEVKGRYVPYEYTIHGTYIEISKYTGKDTEVKIPSFLWLRPVREISSQVGTAGFRELEHVTYVIIPDTVTMLEGAPFWGCWNLEKVELSKNIEEIPSGSFTNCITLKEVVLHENLVEIYGNAFAGCKSLERVIFKNSNTIIGESVFDNGIQSCNFDILTLISAKDSAVEIYAKEHGIKWEELEE